MKLERESRTTEYKIAATDFKKITQTIIAFANGIGGKLIIGVEDKSLKVTGVDPETLDQLLERLPISISDQVLPCIAPLIYVKSIEDKEVLVIEVFPGYQKPYYLASEGIEQGVYVRVGSHTRKADGGVLNELRLNRINLSYDEEILINTSKKDLNTNALPASFRNEKILYSFDILGRNSQTGDVHCTRGGILMLSPNPEKYIPEAEIIISKMKGTSGRETIETQVLNGSIPVLSEQALEILSTWLGSHPVLTKGIYKNTKLKIPYEALRESVNNALFHRQYSIPGAIKIALYTDRLEIFSPGHFAGPFIEESLGDGSSYIRNKVISSLARRMGLIEKRGTGISVIKTSMKENYLRDPVFIEGSNWFKVILYTERKIENEIITVEKEILNLFEKEDFVTSSDVCTKLSVSKATAVAYLEKLIAKNLIKRVNKGPKTKYVLI